MSIETIKPKESSVNVQAIQIGTADDDSEYEPYIFPGTDYGEIPMTSDQKDLVGEALLYLSTHATVAIDRRLEWHVHSIAIDYIGSLLDKLSPDEPVDPAIKEFMRLRGPSVSDKEIDDILHVANPYYGDNQDPVYAMTRV